jgi:glutamine cyclotransferase
MDISTFGIALRLLSVLFLPFVAGCSGDEAVPPAPTLTPTPTPTSVPVPPAEPDPIQATPLYTVEVVAVYPHDPGAWTQGLVYVEDEFYEGTGLWGGSSLRRVDPQTGIASKLVRLPSELFGEGITVLDDRVFQLTWKAGRAFMYDLHTFDVLKEFAYDTEGWGLTHDGTELIMSDGSATLYYRDPQTFEVTGRISVHDENGPVAMLNELEFVEGTIFANVWLTDRIAMIDPETGVVKGWVDAQGLLEPSDVDKGADVLNGIAYDASQGLLFLTGKLWPKIFAVRLVPANS